MNSKIPGFILQQQQQQKSIPITIIFCLVFCNSFSYLDESNPLKKWTMCSLLNPIIIITYHYKPIILVILKKKNPKQNSTTVKKQTVISRKKNFFAIVVVKKKWNYYVKSLLYYNNRVNVKNYWIAHHFLPTTKYIKQHEQKNLIQICEFSSSLPKKV